MNVRLRNDNKLRLILMPVSSGDELLLAAILRMFMEGGQVVVAPNSGRILTYESAQVPIYDDSAENIKGLVEFISCLDVQIPSQG